MPPPSSSPLGLHRVIDPPGVLPQAAWQLDATPGIAPDEVRIRVDRLNLDAASYRHLRETYAHDPDKIRAAVLDIITTRGKMQNPVTNSGGMLTGTVEEVRPGVPARPQTRPARRHPRLANPDPPSDNRRPIPLGHQIRAGPLRRPRHPVRQVHRRRAPRRPPRPPSAGRAGRLRRPRPDEPRGERRRRGGDHRRRRQERLPLRRSRPPGRRRQGYRSRPQRGRSRACCATRRPRRTEARQVRRATFGLLVARRTMPQPESPLVDEIVVADARDPVGLGGKSRGRRGTGRCHRSVRRRPRLRGWGDPVHQASRYGDLLQHGHVLRRRRTGRRGPGRRRHDAGRQRVRAGPRGSRAEPDP